MGKEPTTWAARLRQRFADHQAGAAILLAVAVLAGIGGAIGGFKAVVDLFGSDDPPPPPPVSFTADDLVAVEIPRYGFSFGYPSAWERSDPENSDGATITADRDGVVLRAYGANAFAAGPPPSRERLEYFVEQALGRHDRRRGTAPARPGSGRARGRRRPGAALRAPRAGGRPGARGDGDQIGRAHV